MVRPRRRIRVGKADTGGCLDEKYVGDLIPTVRVQVPAGENGTESNREGGDTGRAKGEERERGSMWQVRKAGKGTGEKTGRKHGRYTHAHYIASSYETWI